MKTPVLIIAHKRYENVLTMLETLRANDCGKIYLAVDGLRRQDAGEREIFANEVSALSKSLNLEIEIWFRKQNLGAAVSVVTAIDWLFSKEISGLILEDDLIIGDDTLAYFENALSYYESDPKVHLIAGSNYWADTLIGLEQPWSSYPITWGWATWRDRWEKLRQCFFTNVIYNHKNSTRSEVMFWRTGVDRCKTGKQDAWDIPLAAFSRQKDGITILPPVNLISNVGADEHAGNTKENIWPLNQALGKMPKNFKFIPTSKFIASESLDELIRVQLYRISVRNVVSGALRLVLSRVNLTFDSDSMHLGNQIDAVVLPS